MPTWNESELAITQSLQRIEASVDRLELAVSTLQASTAEQRGKASTMALWISVVVSALISAIIKKLWK